MPRLKPPQNGATVRMYRQGHGDCFLLAFPRKGGGNPVYVLIDCGYKPKSLGYVHARSINQVVNHIHSSTGGTIDLAIITHEHQDHVNGFGTRSNPLFDRFTINKAWLAWTESPRDRLAKKLRKKHQDQLLQLVEARNELALLSAAGEKDSTVQCLDALMALETGNEGSNFSLSEMRLAVSNPTRSRNKQAMKLVKDKANKADGIDYLSPGQSPLVPNTDVQAYILGPPRRESLLTDEDPVGREEFSRIDFNANSLSFEAALGTTEFGNACPFANRYKIQKGKALKQKHFEKFYGTTDKETKNSDEEEIANNAKWRRIDGDWIRHAETLALKLNRGVNNTSLVVAFELPQTNRVLLFAGDAQRGNWISWNHKDFQVNGNKVTAKQLLGRTVLYKTGHHGSHNATLNGNINDSHPNLSWMGRGRFGAEFTSMITAVNAWAVTNRPPWHHPLPSIKEALLEKSQGRVFQTDTDRPRKPRGVTRATWNNFLNNSEFEKLYFDYQIIDN